MYWYMCMTVLRKGIGVNEVFLMVDVEKNTSALYEIISTSCTFIVDLAQFVYHDILSFLL